MSGLGEPAGRRWGNRSAGLPEAFLYRDSKNPFRQAWLGNKCEYQFGGGGGSLNPEKVNIQPPYMVSCLDPRSYSGRKLLHEGPDDHQKSPHHRRQQIEIKIICKFLILNNSLANEMYQHLHH